MSGKPRMTDLQKKNMIRLAEKLKERGIDNAFALDTLEKKPKKKKRKNR